MSNGEAGRGPWHIKALHSGAADAMRIPRDGLTIGRAESNDIVMPSIDFPSVSGTHARLVVRDGQVYLEDLGSKNGTLVGGQPVTRAPIDHGDVFELGRGGPRFVLLGPSETAQTVLVDPDEVAEAGARRTLGDETVEMMRESLGIPANTKVTDVVTRENRRNTYLLVLVLVVLVGGAVWGVSALRETGSNLDRLQQQIDNQLNKASGRIDAHRDAWERRANQLEAEYARTNEQNKKSLEVERDRLRAELKTRVSADELKRLRSELAEANQRIARYDPVSLEQVRIANVNAVGRSVVLIEVQQTYFEPKTKRLLYVEDNPGSPFRPNLEQKGELYVQESTGSGFCLNQEGWILTNAHVVLKKDAKRTLRLGPDLVLQSKVELNVVFSTTDKRVPAELKDWVAAGSKDLALLKIQPFAKMPHLKNFDTRLKRPEFGTPVYLLGFPLGKRALQQGETMIASAFRGIVSRQVGSFLQVDAAVHRGNSGGPVINEAGQVIGVVVGMQRIDDDAAAPDMGYIIPIDLAGEIWPFNPRRIR